MLRARGLLRSVAGRTLFEGVDLHLRPADRVGLVGRNGTGKTTLLRILAGDDAADDGDLVTRRGARVGLLRQEIDPRADRTLIDEVRTAQAPLARMEREISQLEREITDASPRVPETLAARYDSARLAFEQAGGYEADSRLRATLAGLGFARERWERPLGELSGGWLMRVELAKLLLARPEVLLLDEPTNHLDLPSIAWFEETLESYPGAVLVVSHDRTFLDRHARRIFELDRCQLTTYEGNYSDYERQRTERLRVDDARRRNLDARIAHAQRFVDRFGAKARKASQAQSRKKLIERLEAERPQEERAARSVRLRFPPTLRSGDLVLRLEEVAKAYGSHVVYDRLDCEVRRGDRIALVGPNGAGKSTLLRLIAGTLEPDRGAREPGHNVRLAAFAQHQLEALDGGRTVLEELRDAAPREEMPRLRTVLGTFLFSGDDVDKRVSVLSGGEKSRLALARVLVRGANFLVMDEPTNHLDMAAREVLADALDGYDGTLVLISHDRTFINRLANRVWEVIPGEGSSELHVYPGNYDDYCASSSSSSSSSCENARGEDASREGGRGSPRELSRDEGADRAAIKAARRRAERLVRDLRERCAKLEDEIVEAEAAAEGLGLESADPEVARDGERMRELGTRLRDVRARARDLYTEWERASAELEVAEQALGD